jgi:hypothetical protein
MLFSAKFHFALLLLVGKVRRDMYHAGHIQEIFSHYRRLAFSADLRWKIETFAFLKELATFCKMSADNANPHKWEKFC